MFFKEFDHHFFPPLWTAGSDYKQSLQFRNLNDEKENIHLPVSPMHYFKHFYFHLRHLHLSSIYSPRHPWECCELLLFAMYMSKANHHHSGHTGNKRWRTEASVYLGFGCWRCYSFIHWRTGMDSFPGPEVWAVEVFPSEVLPIWKGYIWITHGLCLFLVGIIGLKQSL